MTEYSEAKSAAAREMNSDQFDDEYDLDRSMRLKIAIEKVFEENADLFERLKDE
jgi:hypothetical protein